MVLDKTGTVTSGHPNVSDIIPAEGISENDLLAAACSLEKLSVHPFANAIGEECMRRGLKTQEVFDFKNIPGRGIQGSIHGKLHTIGNLAMMQELCADSTALQHFSEISQKLAALGKTPVFLSDGSRILGMIALADTVKHDSKEALQLFKHMHLHTVMLTGDNPQTAEAVGKQLEIEDVRAGLLPEDKERIIRELQNAGRKVAMVGDGINDAPALTRADTGIAIGAGTDIAIDAADVVLMKNSLMDAATSIQLSRQTMKNIRENLFWAFFYNIICIPAAAGVLIPFGIHLHPMFGAAAMSLSSVCVVLNALRLRKFRPFVSRSSAEKTSYPGTEPLQQQVTGSYPKSGKESMTLPKSLIQSSQQEKTAMEKIIYVDGMSCGHCTARVEKALKALPGVKNAVASLTDKNVTVTLEEPVETSILIRAIKDAGYEPVEK